jgi:hypothetical protein
MGKDDLNCTESGPKRASGQGPCQPDKEQNSVGGSGDKGDLTGAVEIPAGVARGAEEDEMKVACNGIWVLEVRRFAALSWS